MKLKMNYEDEKLGKLLRANKRLSRELYEFEKIFNAMKDAILLVNEDGMIQYANDSASKMLGFSPNDILKINLLKILPNLAEDVFKKSFDGINSNAEFEIMYPERRFVRLYTSRYRNENSILVILTDITQEKISTAELIESEKISSVLKLAASVAHEIGNPLNSINIHLQLAKRKLQKPIETTDISKFESYLDVCSQEVIRLDNIVKNFLNALRPVRPNFREIEPLKPLIETIKILEKEFQDLKITVNISSGGKLPFILGDIDLLKQCYFNILQNSMDAIGNNGNISISANSNDDDVDVQISDTGIGMNESEVAKLFDPYFTTKSNGNGLGMMIVSEILKSHGARIYVDSKKQIGTTIKISFPRKERRVRALEHDQA